jgi:hypothetical protein
MSDGRSVVELSSIEELHDWASQQDEPPSSITLWGEADKWTFENVEECERHLLKKEWVESGSAPSLGFMAGEDPHQLLWLVYKTLFYQHLRPALPDFLLFTEKKVRRAFESSDHTIVAPHDNPELIRQPLDLALVMAHGKSFDAHLQKSVSRTLTLCSRPSQAINSYEDQQPALCHCSDVCFRDNDPRTTPHERFLVSELESRVFLLNSCASWRLRGELPASSNLAVRALDSCCTAYIGSRYEVEGFTRDCYLAFAAWKAGFSLGQILRLLSPDRLQLYSLIGDPEQRRLLGADVGCFQPVRLGGMNWRAEIRQGVFAIDDAYGSVRFRAEKAGSPQDAGAFVGYTVSLNAPRAYSNHYSFYVVDRPELVASGQLLLRPNPPRPEESEQAWSAVNQYSGLSDQSRVFSALLGDDHIDTHSEFATLQEKHKFVLDNARRVQRSYGAEPGYWPGPFQRDLLEWRQSAGPFHRGTCFSCGLPTMEREVLIQPKSDPRRGQKFSKQYAVKCLERYCQRCYQIAHLPFGKEDELEFDVVREISVNTTFSITLRKAPHDEGVFWVAVFAIEQPSEGHVPAVFPAPRMTPKREGTPWTIEGGLNRPGLHFVRLYFCRLADLTLYGVSSLIRCIK